MALRCNCQYSEPDGKCNRCFEKLGSKLYGKPEAKTGKQVANGAWFEISDDSEDFKRRFYSRARYERNFARAIHWHMVNVEPFDTMLFGKVLIDDWQYEPDTFGFRPEDPRESTKYKAKTSGVVSYKPDFKLHCTVYGGFESVIIYCEVKGWMDPKSKTKLNCMKKHYPSTKIIVIDPKWFKAMTGVYAGRIPQWEGSVSSGFMGDPEFYKEMVVLPGEKTDVKLHDQD